MRKPLSVYISETAFTYRELVKGKSNLILNPWVRFVKDLSEPFNWRSFKDPASAGFLPQICNAMQHRSVPAIGHFAAASGRIRHVEGTPIG